MNLLRFATTVLTCTALIVLAGCSTTGNKQAGGYYKDDGPEANPPAGVASTPDAVPRIETYHKGTSKPYVVFGKRYVPVKPDHSFTQRGTASWYGKKFNGNTTASGEKYNMYAMTAAHPTLPIPSYARVTRVSTGKSIVVRINDRGPFHSKRIIDLSYAAADKLGLIHDGSGEVIVQAITNDDIRNGNKPLADQHAPIGSVSDIHPASATATQNAPAPTGKIYLQFGAFQAEQNARHLANKLNQEIKQAEGDPVQVTSGADLYRVQLGPFPDRTTAVNAAWRIRQATGTASTIAVRHPASD